MGYDLTIGEFEVVQRPEERYAQVSAKHHSEPGAPLNSSGDQSNSCSPSYAQWGAFARDVGLYDVFCENWRYNGEDFEAVLSSHPGAVALTQAHLERFQAAKDLYSQRPEQEPYTVKRLAWLVWWTEWALKNCTYPTFANR